MNFDIVTEATLGLNMFCAHSNICYIAKNETEYSSDMVANCVMDIIAYCMCSNYLQTI